MTFVPGGTTMTKFIIGTFLMLGIGFCELSSRFDFEPKIRPITQTVIETKSLEVVPFDAPIVTRAVFDTIPFAAIEKAQVFPTSIAAAPSAAAIPIIFIDLRQVSGRRVNMRSGPGTNYGVLDKLTRGTQTEVIEVNANGWVRIRVTTTDQVGWVSSRLLTPS